MRNEEVNLGKYIDFIKSHKSIFNSYINLDVIPGSKGVRPTVREVEYAAARSFENYETMVNAGLRPIPVFHYGENFRWLEKFVEAGADYICVGGTVKIPIKVKQKFLDDCFTILTNARGEPLVRVHGLGILSHKLLLKYPWYSVDSATWATTAEYGMIKVPRIDCRGQFDFSCRPLTVTVGNDLSKIKQSIKSFDKLPSSVLDEVVAFIEAGGTTVASVRSDAFCRCMVNLEYWKRLQAYIAGRQQLFNRPASFDFSQPRKNASPVAIDFRIIFSSSIGNDYRNLILTKKDIKNRLLSYFELRSYKEKDVATYIAEGVLVSDPVRERSRVDWKARSYRDFRRRSALTRYEVI